MCRHFARRETVSIKTTANLMTQAICCMFNNDYIIEFVLTFEVDQHMLAHSKTMTS